MNFGGLGANPKRSEVHRPLGFDHAIYVLAFVHLRGRDRGRAGGCCGLSRQPGPFELALALSDDSGTAAAQRFNRPYTLTALGGRFRFFRSRLSPALRPPLGCGACSSCTLSHVAANYIARVSNAATDPDRSSNTTDELSAEREFSHVNVGSFPARRSPQPIRRSSYLDARASQYPLAQ